MNTPTGRLVPAPDMQSAAVSAYKTIGTAPVVVRLRQQPVQGPGRHSTSTKVPTMAKRTRGPDPVDRLTRLSGVNITPPTDSGPVTSTSPVA